MNACTPSRERVGIGGAEEKIVTIRCGQCLECRNRYIGQMAVRVSHEMEYHSHCYFLSLTYEDTHLPPGGSLCKADLRNFIKRLRNYHSLRYIACGEYGEQGTYRPHYHVMLFMNNNIVTETYRSDIIARCWQKGFYTIKNLDVNRIYYIYKYMTKADKEEHLYSGRVPPFTCMSTKPAIGGMWLNDNMDKLVSDSHRGITTIAYRGRFKHMPRYYMKKLPREWHANYKYLHPSDTKVCAYDQSPRQKSQIIHKNFRNIHKFMLDNEMKNCYDSSR